MTDVQTGIVVKQEEGADEPAGPSGPPLIGLEYRDTRFIGAPAYPDVLAVSAHGQVAVALGSAVRVLDGATLAPIAVVKSADLVGESHDYARDVSGNALARSKQAPKRQRAAEPPPADEWLLLDGAECALDVRRVASDAPELRLMQWAATGGDAA